MKMTARQLFLIFLFKGFTKQAGVVVEGSPVTISSTIPADSTTALIVQWCLPNFNFTNSTDPYQQLLHAQLSVCEAAAATAYNKSTPWGVENLLMPYAVFNSRYAASSTYMLSNQSVSTAFLNDHCYMHFMVNIYYGAMNLLYSSYSLSESTESINTIHFVYFPFSLYFVWVSAHVIHQLGKHEKDFRFLPYFYTDLVAQLLAYIIYTAVVLLELTPLFYTPFCYISPFLAINLETIVGSFPFSNYYPFLGVWLYQAYLRVVISFDRFVAFYFPVWYSTRLAAGGRTAKTVLTLFTLLHVSIYLLFTTGCFVVAFQGQIIYSWTSTNGRRAPNVAYIQQATAGFGVGLLGVAAALQLGLSIALAVKLQKKTVVSYLGQQTSTVNRRATVLVLSVTPFYCVSYFAQAWLLVVSLCRANCMQQSTVNTLSTFTQVVALAIPFLLDLNAIACFALQCTFSSSYRVAVRGYFRSSIFWRIVKALKNHNVTHVTAAPAPTIQSVPLRAISTDLASQHRIH